MGYPVFYAVGDLNQSHATVRWTVACRQLDGGNTIIYSNPSIHTILRFAYLLTKDQRYVHIVFMYVTTFDKRRYVSACHLTGFVTRHRALLLIGSTPLAQNLHEQLQNDL